LTVPSAPFFNYSDSYVFFFYGEIEKKVVFYAERRESEIRRLEGRKEKKSLDFFFSAASGAWPCDDRGRGEEPNQSPPPSRGRYVRFRPPFSPYGNS
jgi:hypothetical protein